MGVVDFLVRETDVCSTNYFQTGSNRPGGRLDLTPILSRVILISEAALGEAFDLECAKDALSDEANYWTIFAR